MNPLHLLRIEAKKFLPNSTFCTVLVLYVVFGAGAFFLACKVGTNFHFESNGTEFNPASDLFQFPRIWELLSWIGSWLNMSLLGFLGVHMITMEFGYKTLRQSVIFGLSRTDAWISKVTALVTIALGLTVFYVILGLVGGLLAGGSAGASPTALLPLSTVIPFFLQALGYLLLGTLAGLLIRQTALATLAYLAYVFFLETFVRWLVYLTVVKSRLLYFLPDNALDKLTPFPVPASLGQMADEAQKALAPLTGPEALVASAAWILLFGFLLHRRFTKADL